MAKTAAGKEKSVDPRKGSLLYRPTLVWLWAARLSSLGLHFFICKVRIKY